MALALPSGLSSTYGSTYPICQDITNDYLAELINSGDDGLLAKTLYDMGQQGEAAAAQYGYMEMVGSLLNHPNPEVAAAACAAVRGAGPRGHNCVREVGALLKVDDAELKYQACMTIASMGPVADGTCVALLDLLYDKHDGVKCAACAALGSIKVDYAVDNLSKLLGDACPEVQGAACMALGKLGKAGANKASDIAKFIDTQRTRLAAITALGEMKEVSASHLEEVCKCLTDEDEEIRTAAAIVIGKKANKTNSAGVLSTSMDLLSHQDGRFRAIAAVALGNMGPQAGSAVNSIKDLLTDDFQASAATALTVGGVRSRAPAEIRKVKCAGAYALGSIGTKGALYADEVGALLSEEDWEARLAACESLAMMGKAAAKSASQVCGILKDTNYMVRAKAAKTLGKFGNADYVDAIADLISDAAPTVAAEALIAMGQMGNEAKPHLLKIASQVEAHNASVRAAAVKALADLGEIGAYYAGIVAMRLEEGEAYFVKVAAIEALGNMGDRGKAYQEEIAMMTDDPVEEVRKQAAATCAVMSGVQPTGSILNSVPLDGEE